MSEIRERPLIGLPTPDPASLPSMRAAAACSNASPAKNSADFGDLSNTTFNSKIASSSCSSAAKRNDNSAWTTSSISSGPSKPLPQLPVPVNIRTGAAGSSVQVK
jgi:hypothetical protein